MNQTRIEIDAAGQVLGRLATRVANVLRAKDQPQFRRDRLPSVEVVVCHVADMKVSGRKLEQKYYYRFSGYPHGLKKRRLDELMSAHPDRVLRAAVRGMLPDNRLRDRLLKHLIIT